MNVLTPAFLFSAISLLMSAYISRFSRLACLIRTLQEKEKTEYVKFQMKIIEKRLIFIKYIQLFSVLSLFNAVSTILIILLRINILIKLIFSISLVLFMTSLILAIIELYYSTQALELDLKE